MDAISFVLGVRSAQLRSSQLKELIYRAGAQLENGQNGDADADGQAEEPDDDEQREQSAKKAWVMAVYIDRKGKEWKYQRTSVISTRRIAKQRVLQSAEAFWQDHPSRRIRIQDQR